MKPDPDLNLRSMAQTATPPSPEVGKLDYFVGTWRVEGTIASGPWGPGGDFSWTDTTKWMRGNFFVIGHWDFKTPPELGGDGEEIFIMGYDTSRKVYSFDAFSSQGRRQVSQGTHDGKVWTWTSQAIYGEQKVKQRMVLKILSLTSYELIFEVSSDGVNWTRFMEGTALKT
jgi:Protein of unknown function (DUF1579)